MLKERARVISVDKSSIWVEASRTQGCAKCEAGEGCGGGVLGKLVKRSTSKLEVHNEIEGLRPGDEVLIGLNEQALLKSSVMAYLIPLVGLFAGAMIAEFFLDANDLAVAAMGVIGLATGFLVLRHFSLKTAMDQRYQPIVLGKSPVSGSACQVYVVEHED